MKKIIFETKYIRLVEKETALSKDKYHYIERPTGDDVVCIIPLTKDKHLVFIKEYRVPFDQYVISFPAGLTGDLGPEEIEEAAKRELIEESGYTGNLKLMTKGPPSSGLASEIMHFYLATDCEQVSNGGGDETEKISVFKVPFNMAQDWLDKQEKDSIIDPKIYLGLYFVNYLNLV
jgi:ADP-ribose pyrophosphatase